jgi:hypothetical protein
MRVRCVRHVNDRGEDSDGSPLETAGEYVVIEMSGDLPGRVDVRVALYRYGGLATPALIPARVFETTDGTIPSNWSVKITDEPNGIPHFVLGPTPWLRVGFWEDYFDDRPEARSVYETELQTTLAESAAE